MSAGNAEFMLYQLESENTSYIYDEVGIHCNEFKVGIGLLNINATDKAQNFFQLAYESVNYKDLYHNKYASFCGLSRILNGDMAGLQLCREAARNEKRDADVFLNLARAEWQLKRRLNTIIALDKGLRMNKRHLGIYKMKEELGVRKRKIFPILDRSHPLNNFLGKLLRAKDL